MPLSYRVPENKRKRVIIDTDAACEADDPFAIAHALMSKKLDVKAIFAEHFVLPGSMERSYREVLETLDAMKVRVPVFKGEPGPLSTLVGGKLSEASKFLIDEANRPDEKPLFVLCIGAITNIATAIRADP